MRDAQIRAALADQLVADHPAIDSRVWSEFAVSLGASRVDICLINGSLSGWEIKSPRDNFARLAGQVEHYSRVLDFAHIVVAKRDLERARASVPPWWGVVVAEEEADGGVNLRTLRKARENRYVDALSVAQLLWRDEALGEVQNRRLPGRWSKATRWQLWDALVGSMPLIELRSVVRGRLKARPLRSADRLYMRDGAMLQSPAT